MGQSVDVKRPEFDFSFSFRHRDGPFLDLLFPGFASRPGFRRGAHRQVESAFRGFAVGDIFRRAFELAAMGRGRPDGLRGIAHRVGMKFTKTIFLFLWFLSLGAATIVSAQPDAGNLTEALKTYSHLSNEQKDLVSSSMGMPNLSDFSLAKIIAWLIFGAAGFVAFVYGKKRSDFKVLVIGIVLMGYPYLINGTFWLYAVGIGLCVLLYFWHD